MATIVLDSTIIKESLLRTRAEINKCIDWSNRQEGNVPLEVPEPWELLTYQGPVSRHCVQGDDCGDIGVYMGVIARLAAGAGRKPKARTRRRK